MVRPATLADVPRMVDLGEKFYNMTPHARFIPYNPTSTTFLFIETLKHADSIVFVSEVDGLVIGAIGGTISPSTYNFDYKVVLENYWFFDPDHKDGRDALRLVSALEQWAKERGAAEFMMGLFTGINQEALTRLYTRKGYTQSECLFVKGV